MTDIIAEDIRAETTGGAAGDGGALALTPVQKAIYSTGDFTDGVTGQAFAWFVLFYLNVVVGMSASLAGFALAVTLVIDAVADPMVGYLSDNVRSRWGRRHPFMIVSAIPFAVSMGMLFAIPHFSSQWVTFAYVVAVLLVQRLSYSFFFLPYIALGAELARDYGDRSVLMAYRNYANVFAQLVAISLGFGVFMSGGGLFEYSAYIPFGLSCTAIILFGAAVSTLGTLPFRDRMYATAPHERSAAARALGELKDVFGNHSFMMLLLTIVIFWIAQGTAINLGTYNFTYFWKIDAGTINLVLIVGTFGLFAGTPVCSYLLRHFEKRAVCTWGIIGICLLLILPPVLRVAGLLPFQGTLLTAILAAFTFTQSVVLTNVFVSFNSMMVDATDEHEYLFGVRREGLYFSALSFSGKAAIGIGGFVAGLALDYVIGFPSDIAVHPHQALSDWSIVKLGLIAGPGCAAISIFSAITMARYRIVKSELLRIQAELRARNAGGAV
jgi:GPH family glycoside/pentoside/hexuronide:cation symporter